MPRSNHRRTDPTTFAALDALPPELYREVTFAARVWDAIDILALYKDARDRNSHEYAVGWLAASIQMGDEQDVLAFGRIHFARHRYALPHLGAEATILRYVPPVGVRRQYLPPGKSPRVKAAWAASERLMPVASV